MSDDQRLVTVCSVCLCASCWQGEFMCQEAIGASTIEMTIAKLKLKKLEHPCYWEEEKEVKSAIDEEVTQ